MNKLIIQAVQVICRNQHLFNANFQNWFNILNFEEKEIDKVNYLIYRYHESAFIQIAPILDPVSDVRLFLQLRNAYQYRNLV